MEKKLISILSALVLCGSLIITACGRNDSNSASSAKAITAFSFTSPIATGTIDENAKTISVTVPYGTSVTALVASFTTTGASVKVGTTIQVSGTTPNDFSNPVLYVVTAADNSTSTYTVTVMVTVTGGTSPMPGTLDTSFGTGGTVTTHIGTDSASANSVALQADGKIIAAGYCNLDTNYYYSNFALVRYNNDGSLDTGFGTDGKVITTSIGQAGNDQATSVVIQPDGKIVAAGAARAWIDDDFALVRYNSDGSLDTTFGTGGTVTTAIGSGSSGASSVALQADGKIVAAGYCTGSNYSDFALIRYNSDGTLDTSFGSGGTVTTAIRSGSSGASSVALQADGKIVAAGNYKGSDYWGFALIRYNSDGSLDTGFGTGGTVTTSVGTNRSDSLADVAIQSDGKIVAVGESYNGPRNDDSFALVRYNADGTLDTGFGTGGTVTTPIGDPAWGIQDVATSVAIQSDGKIVAAGGAGHTTNSGYENFTFVRYNTDGTLDTGFGTGGTVAIPIGTSFGIAWSVAIQPNGKIVAAGYTGAGSDSTDFALVRYWP